ncbi:MAG TPA: LysM peptidoglycan-binding domain-containing protein [Thermoanaerobaculia bacterium]
MRVRRTGFVLAVFLVGAVSVQAADRPPKDLHLVGDHWTAWNPPTPDPGVQVHVVAKGDTLWDIAAKYYGNAYLWPQVWEKNKYVLDAHWIYPGDPLVLGLNVAPVDTLAQAGAGAATTTPGGATVPTPGEVPVAAPPPGVMGAGEAAGTPVPLGAESDIYCQGYVGDLDDAFPFRILGSEYESLSLDSYIHGASGWTIGDFRSSTHTVKVDLTTGDIIYIDGGQARGLLPGSQFTVVGPEQPVTHPISRKIVGRYYRYLGRIRVLSVQDTTAIAEIVQTCDPIITGALLTPFEPEPVPLGRSTAMRPLNYPAAADKIAHAPAIVYAKDDLLALGADHVVHIDVGEQETTPGDMFTIYRENRPGLPPIIVGELAVLSVHKRFSVAKIIESRYPIRIGDRLDPK